jgi:hypothetical protein
LAQIRVALGRAPEDWAENLLSVRSRSGGQSFAMTVANDLAVRRAPEAAGLEFIDENGGPGVRLRKRERLQKPR